MTRLLKYLKGSAIICAIIAPLMMCIEVFMDLYQPTLMSNIIDIGIANGDMHYVLTTGGKMLIMAVIGVFGGAGSSLFASAAAMNLGKNLRQSLFDKIQTLSFAEIDTFKTSSLITRLTNDVTQMQNMMLMALRIMVRAPLLCMGGIVMAVSLSLELSKVFIISVPIIIIGVIIIVKRSLPMFISMQKKIDRVNVVMRENLLGIRVIKAFTMEGKQEQRFDASNMDLMDTSIKAQNNMLMLWPIVTLTMNLSVILVLWFGGNMVNVGTIEVGKIMAFVNYLTQIMHSLMMVVMIIMNFSRASASSERINEVFDTEPSIVSSKVAKAIQNFDIEFKNVSFKYNKEGDYVLKDISFKALEGEVIGIIGATGSGKSSFISLIPRLYDTTEGEVLLGGIDVKDLKIEDIRNNIGVILQESTLFSGTIKDNLLFGNQNATEEEIESSSKDAQAYEFISRMPDKYDSIVEQRGKNLSGGQKQRVSIARTLVSSPKILIMDDSSSALDMSTEAKLQEAIKARMKDSTVIIIAQRISAVMDADKIIVLDDGKISSIGTHKELLENNEIYRGIAISQLGEEVVLNGRA
jgi:ATP-binding cassette subfamily B protein